MFMLMLVHLQAKVFYESALRASETINTLFGETDAK